MKRLRLGNDLQIAWSFMNDGQSFDLEGRDIILYLKSTYEEIRISDFEVRGNRIIWTFRGKDQKHLGTHSLTASVRDETGAMITIDQCNFVDLVDCSCQTGGKDTFPIETSVLNLQSLIETGVFGHAEEVLQSVCFIDFTSDFCNDFSTGL